MVETSACTLPKTIIDQGKCEGRKTVVVYQQSPPNPADMTPISPEIQSGVQISGGVRLLDF